MQGWRVELAEIDQAVRGCAGIEDAVTIGAPTGDGSTALVVFYTGTPAQPSDLAVQLRRTLPPGIVPRRYHHLAEFPLNPNRKVDRAGLRDRAAKLLTGPAPPRAAGPAKAGTAGSRPISARPPGAGRGAERRSCPRASSW
ncbi:hypothetical protein ACFQYP_42420 [Nonomuraea antimicrobica]